MGNPEAAEADLLAAQDAGDERPAALNNLGLLRREQGRYRESLSCFEAALAETPRYSDARLNQALVLSDLGRLDEAEAALKELANSDSPHVRSEARMNLAFAHLRLGEFAAGWEFFEERWNQPRMTQRPFRLPPWNGDPLSGRRLLVYGEQGLGDEVMFAGCLPDLFRAADGSPVVLECDGRLAKLFARSFPQALVHGRAQPDDMGWLAGEAAAEVQIPIGSLPALYRRRIEDFPAGHTWLKADPARTTHWHERLAALGPGLKVGVSWRGGAVQTRSALRSMNLSQWLPILQTPDTHFLSLQYTDCRTELNELAASTGITVHHWQEAIDDYDETAALVSALDLLISVPTSVVSLASALGVPTWAFVPYSPSWLFMQEGDTTPWLPSARLFRQGREAVWDGEIARVAATLGEHLAQ